MDNKAKSIIYALLAAVFYAINIPLSKLLLNHVGATTRSELQEELREAQQELQKLYDSYDIELSKNPKILHITTYQNDNYWYTDIKNYSGEYNYLNRNDDLVFGIDVDAIVQELDKLLTWGDERDAQISQKSI